MSLVVLSLATGARTPPPLVTLRRGTITAVLSPFPFASARIPPPLVVPWQRTMTAVRSPDADGRVQEGHIRGTVWAQRKCVVQCFEHGNGRFVAEVATNANGTYQFDKLIAGYKYDLRYGRMPGRNDKTHTGVMAGAE